MQKILQPLQINGTIVAPASKSVMIRAIAAAALCEGKTTLKNFTVCNDAEAAVNIIKSLGAKVEFAKNEISITGKILSNDAILNCGESALSARIFTPIAAVICNNVKVYGEGSLLRRDMSPLVQALKMLGLQCDNKKFIPLKISGKINCTEISIDGSGGSQTLSGLLAALPLCKSNCVINVENLKSKPYIDLTTGVLKNFGIEILNDDYKKFLIKGGQTYQSCGIYNIEGDWSGASCLLVSGAIGGKICVRNLNKNSLQADSAIIDVLRLCGAMVNIENDKIIVEKNQLKAFNFNATDCPDLFPAIVALAANCKGTSCIKGALRLKNKESNRAEILQQEFATLGIKILLNGDEMQIFGNKIHSATVNAHNDHRIAMALAAASVNACGQIIVDDAECVAKTYPRFWDDFASVQKS